jgi:hypothetical protein
LGFFFASRDRHENRSEDGMVETRIAGHVGP